MHPLHRLVQVAQLCTYIWLLHMHGIYLKLPAFGDVRSWVQNIIGHVDLYKSMKLVMGLQH